MLIANHYSTYCSQFSMLENITILNMDLNIILELAYIIYILSTMIFS